MGEYALTRPSLRITAYEAIKGWIGTNRLPGGSVTSEIRLSEQLDMSRTPVRAALQQLETEGFLRIVPKHGVLILHDSAQRVSDLLELLASLIIFAYEQNKRVRAAEIAGIAAGFPIASIDRETPERLVQTEADLWTRLISLGRNEEMLRLWQMTADKVHWPVNDRRWKSPYRPDTEKCLTALLASMTDSSGPFEPDFFAYLHILKKTWS